MINKFVKGRVYVFIDAANILYSQQTLHWRVELLERAKYLNIKKLKDHIVFLK